MGTSNHEHRFCCFGNGGGIGVQNNFLKLKPCFDSFLLNKHGVKFVCSSFRFALMQGTKGVHVHFHLLVLCNGCH
jgi:hypothetical protein